MIPCCTDEPRSAPLLCPAQIPAPSWAAQSLRRRRPSKPERDLPGTPRALAASASRGSLSLRPAPHTARRRCRARHSPRCCSGLGAGPGPSGAGRGRIPPAGAAAILAGRGRRRSAGNGGRGAGRDPGAPAATERGFQTKDCGREKFLELPDRICAQPLCVT